jgi:F-type H+-transporting ATPase subunit delta
MAGRYATALFELALEAKALDPVKADLDRFDALLAESADLRRLVRSPVFGAEEQGKALTAVLERANAGLVQFPWSRPTAPVRVHT